VCLHIVADGQADSEPRSQWNISVQKNEAFDLSSFCSLTFAPSLSLPLIPRLKSRPKFKHVSIKSQSKQYG